MDKLLLFLLAPQSHLELEEETQIFNRQLAQRLIRVGAKCRLGHGQLFRLELDNLVFDRIFDDKLDNCYRPFLTQSMDPVHGLVLDGRVPLLVS